MEHKKIDLGNIHKPHNWEFADATARAAAVIADSDLIGALALQLDDGTYWRLTSVGPTVWTKAATPNATDAELRDRSTHTGSQAISSVTGLQTALDAAASHASSTSNPHAVTKAQVGLGNVENKSSADIRSEISSGNVTTALGYTPLAPSAVGDTVASLVAGKVPSSQLPAYVDDVLEYANLAGFPGTGTAGIIYVALDTDKTYRWSGSSYTEISPSPGSTDSVSEGSSNLYFTAARVRDAVLTGLTTVSSAVISATDTVIGAFQKLQAQITAHTTNTSNPHAVTKAQVGLGNVENKSSADIRSEISSGNVTTALGYTPLAPSAVGDTVASLVAGKVPSSQLPAYVDDVLEYANLAGFPGTGTAGIIYVALDTNKTYRWSGSGYTEISPSPGSTDSVTEGSSNLYFTAARVRDAVLTGLTTVSSEVISATDTVIGAFQKLQAQITAHTTNTSNPHSVTKTQVGLGSVDNTSDADKPISTATQTALDEKFDKAGGTITGNVGIGTAPSSFLGDVRLVVGSAVTTAASGGVTVYSGNASYGGLYFADGLVGNQLTRGAIEYAHNVDELRLYAAGAARMTLDSSGNLLVGTTSNGSSAKMVVYGGNGVTVSDGTFTGYIGKGSWVTGASASDFGVRSNTNLLFMSGGGTERGRFDTGGNLLVGTSSGSYHTIRKNVTADAGNAVAEIQGDAGATAVIFYGVSGYGANAANAAAKFGFDNVTSRSINAGGTINASGADAAEYERNGGLKIAKGQIVGFGPDGVLTDKFDSAIRFGVKSTDPHIVGGDTWGTEDKIGKRPEEPKFTPPEYTGRAKPEDLPEDATEEQASQHARDMADWNEDQVEHKARTDIERNLFDTATYPEYLRDKAAFEERLEAARQQVDRVAYCGKVPCNVQGATPGDYIVAVNDGNGGIKGLPVRNPTFEQYRAAVGRVNRILPDGRAEIAVIVH